MQDLTKGMELFDSTDVRDIDKERVVSPVEIDNEPFLFELDIYGKKYIIDVQWLLSIRNGISSDKSDFELEESLERISSYMHMFSTAYEYANERKIKAELEYELWEVEKIREAELSLHEKQLREVELGKRTKSGIILSSGAVRTEMILNNKDEYKERKENINRLKNLTDFLLREMKIIEQRGNHLQSLLKKRAETIRNIA